jgi:hypothetical protein
MILKKISLSLTKILHNITTKILITITVLIMTYDRLSIFAPMKTFSTPLLIKGLALLFFN